MATPGCEINSLPISGPKPVTTLKIPSGMPASFVNAANSSVLAEVNSDGLTMTAQPAASAAAHFQATNRSGVPRRECRHDADRLMHRVGEGIGLVDRHQAAFELVDEPAEIPPPFRMVAKLAQHLGHELAIVAHLDFGEPFRVRSDEIAELAHRLAARRCRHLRPGATPHGLIGGLHGPVGIGGRTARNLRPGLAAIGIVGIEPLAVGGVNTYWPLMKSW